MSSQESPSPLDPPENKNAKDQAYFPLGFYVEFLEMLADRPDVFEVLTYDDLPWGDDYDHANNYPQEQRNWQAQLKSGARSRDKIYVILQHDVDSSPHRTIKMLREEQRLNIPSNVMIFTRRVNRRHMNATGELQLTDYPLDYDYLKRLEREHRFAICYHANSFEQALFDRAQAMAIFERDVAQLREHFNINFFSPHGGARSPDGESNNSLPIPDSLTRSLRWVANKQSVRLDASFSDGGPNSPARDPAQRDLRDFVRTWRRGGRYRVLTHPQYYDTRSRPSPRMEGTPWYDQVRQAYADNPRPGLWAEVAARF